MTRLKLKHVHRFRDRHGKVRHYCRKPGHKAVPLPGEVGSVEFMEAYGKALGENPKPITKYKPDTFGALVAAWYQSTEFKQLADSTKAVYKNIAERFAADKTDLMVKDLQPRNVRRIIAARAETPGAANNLLKVLRLMLGFAVADDWIPINPAASVKKVKVKSDGRHSWTEAEIAKFENHWPIGSRARLALALLLYTAQRRSDVIRMGRQHIKGNLISVVQQKTGSRLEIPMHWRLREIIDATSSDHLTFLTTAAGGSFTSAGFGNLFRQYCDDAGLPPECAAHGLRKAACRRLAEAGCSAPQLMAFSGHKSLAEAQRYIESVNQITLAVSSLDKLEGSES